MREVDTHLADIFRRLLKEDHGLIGSQLTVSATLELREGDFDVLWDTLDELEGDDWMVSLP